MKKKLFDWNGFCRNLIIVFWIGCLFFLIILGNINLFIKKSYLFLPILGTLILSLILAARIVKKKEEKKENPWVFIILIIPLAFALGVRPGNLGEFAASRKGLVTSGVAMEEKSRDKLIRELEKTRSYQHLNLKKILALTESGLTNLKLKTEGLIIAKKNGSEQHYYLVRFLITCCAADALPLAVEIKRPDGFETSAGHWTEIWGILHSDPEGFFIEVEKALPLPEPQNPYLY